MIAPAAYVATVSLPLCPRLFRDVALLREGGSTSSRRAARVVPRAAFPVSDEAGMLHLNSCSVFSRCICGVFVLCKVYQL
jgi:hypothetical protein